MIHTVQNARHFVRLPLWRFMNKSLRKVLTFTSIDSELLYVCCVAVHQKKLFLLPMKLCELIHFITFANAF